MGQTGVRAPHHEDDGDSTMSLRGGVSCRCPVWTRSSHRKLVNTTLNETCRPFNRYSRPIRTLRYHPTGYTPQLTHPKRAHQTTKSLIPLPHYVPYSCYRLQSITTDRDLLARRDFSPLTH